MYSEYKQKKKNKKALLLLFALGVFGFFAFKYTKVKDIAAEDNTTEAAACTTTVTDNSYESNSVFLDIGGNGSITEVKPQQGSVLGVNSNCGIKGINKFTGESSCIFQNARSTFSLNGKKYVSKGASIVMDIITVPIFPLSGSFNVENNLGNLTKQNGYIPPAGKVNKTIQIEANTTPDEHDQVVADVIEKQPKNVAYSTKYTVSTDGKQGSDEVTIGSVAKNNCGALCDNEANNNPAVSNASSKWLGSSFYKTPGQVAEEQKNKSEGQSSIEGDCANSDMAEWLGFPVCVNVVSVVAGALGSLFPSSDWTQCSEDGESDEGCVKSETISIKISPMFTETNEFTQERNKTQMDPDSSASYQSVYVVTQCHALVAGMGVPVKCIWDLSYLFHLRQAAEFDDTEEGETPTVEEYKAYLEKQSARTDTLYTL
jgi:hypothetical protein